MKTAVVFFVILLAGCRIGSQAKELGPEEEECILELNLDREEIKRIDAQKPVPEDNANFNEYTLCYCTKMGIINSNGVMNFDKIKEVAMADARKEPRATPPILSFYENVLTKGINVCKGNPPTGTTHALTVVKTLNCIDTAMRQALGR